MTDPEQYDGFATYEELNLSSGEVKELKENKRKLTDYARKKLKERIQTVNFDHLE